MEYQPSLRLCCEHEFNKKKANQKSGSGRAVTCQLLRSRLAVPLRVRSCTGTRPRVCGGALGRRPGVWSICRVWEEMMTASWGWVHTSGSTERAAGTSARGWMSDSQGDGGDFLEL